GAHERAGEMGEEAEILAFAQRLHGPVTDLAPVGLGGQRRGLPEQTVGIERGQQLRVLEILPAGILGREGLEKIRVCDLHGVERVSATFQQSSNLLVVNHLYGSMWRQVAPRRTSHFGHRSTKHHAYLY